MAIESYKQLCHLKTWADKNVSIPTVHALKIVKMVNENNICNFNNAPLLTHYRNFKGRAEQYRVWMEMLAYLACKILLTYEQKLGNCIMVAIKQKCNQTANASFISV